MTNRTQDSIYVTDQLIAEDIEAYLHQHQHKDLLRFITCGSVDDGKSTLIGRLLFDSKMIFEDHLVQLEADSKKMGTQGEKLDLALLVDGLAAEREQGITIDVAYRFFATETRKFIVADTPGHEQYTRNMVTGASTADAAIILIDARKGVLTQTRRHSYLAHLVGVRNIVLAINKMDLVDFDEQVFRRIVAEYREVADAIGIDNVTAIPTSALEGDNIASRSHRMPWYDGDALIPVLDRLPIPDDVGANTTFRMPTQWVNRPDLDFRGFSGLITGGRVAVGDTVRVLPAGKATSVSRIVTMDGDLDTAVPGQSVTLTLTDEVDCSRGDVIAAAADAPPVSDQFEATLVWMAEEPMLPGRPYWLKAGTQTVTATVPSLKHQINVNTLEHQAAKTLELNGIGVVNLSTDRDIVFEPYDRNRTLGGFILIDKMTNRTVAAGMLHFALRRATNVHWQSIDVTRDARAEQKQQRPTVVWFTGLSGAGKSTIANLVDKRLFSLGMHSYLLDGDNVRHGLCRDLGFTDADRVENLRRVGEVSKLMTDAGLIVLAAFISPFAHERQMVHDMLRPGEYVEVFVDTPLAEAERRDVKGLYASARAGDLPRFTGIDSPYEVPRNPDLRIDTTTTSPEEAAEQVLALLTGRSDG